MKLIHCPYYTTEPVTEQDIEMWIEAEVSTESSDEGIGVNLFFPVWWNVHFGAVTQICRFE